MKFCLRECELGRDYPHEEYAYSWSGFWSDPNYTWNRRLFWG